jgi:transcriptional regulator with XRE-family HTH domain
LNKDWSPEERAQIDALKEKYDKGMTLGSVRQDLDITQQRMAKLMKTTQGNVSRLERRHDMMLSTLRGYLAAMDGVLELSVRFQGHSVKLSGLGQLRKKTARRTR